MSYSSPYFKWIIFIVMVIQYWLGFYIGHIGYVQPSFDYYLNLDEDSIHISTDQNIDTTIHFDDLEKFIINDNL